MPQQTNLNVAPYFDDFDPTNDYHKVLFKPGYPVQARELTSLQSILQNQIERFGQHFFKEGAIVEDVIGETTNEVKGQVITQPDGKFSVRQGEEVIESNVESKEDALKVLSDNIEVAPEVKVTKKTEVTEVRGDKVSTKTPVTISYNRNTEPAPKMGKEFGQDVEASGTYVTQKVSDFTPQGFETGNIQLKSPLRNGS